MKKNLMFLAVGLLAIGSVFAAELNDSPVTKAEVAVSAQDVDFSALEYAKTDAAALPDAVKNAVTKLEEAGAKMRWASAAKTEEGVKVFKVTFSKDDATQVLYFGESGEILKTEKMEGVVEQPK